jgi:hypothetical protein
MAKICAGSLLLLWTSSVGRVLGFAPPVIKAWSVRPTNSEAAQTPARRSPQAPTPRGCSPRVLRRAAELGRQLEAFDPAEIRCPFFRRRATDTLEALVVVGTWLRARHKRVDLTFGLLPLSTRANSFNAHQRAAAARKAHNLPLGVVAALLARDFAEKKCQVTGRLSRQLFDEACVFDGPGTLI